MKHEKGEKGLASLVSHIHSKINKTSSEWSQKEISLDIGLSQRSLDIQLSPINNQVLAQNAQISEEVEQIFPQLTSL